MKFDEAKLQAILNTISPSEPRIVYLKHQPTYKEASHIVDGYVEVIQIADNLQMICNEEGLIFNLPLNSAASEIAGCKIVGNVILLEGKNQWHSEGDAYVDDEPSSHRGILYENEYGEDGMRA